MKTKHQYALRPYHNPQNADESLVPPGWRMLYADEFPLKRPMPCKLFINPMLPEELDPPYTKKRFSERSNCQGRIPQITYIVLACL